MRAGTSQRRAALWMLKADIDGRAWYAWSRSRHASAPASSHIETSTWTRLRNVSRRWPLLDRYRADAAALTGFPISVLLVSMIYTATWALKYLSIPVYTIFKNLTIILIAYGEVLWFGGTVTSMALFSFGLMVLSSVVAAWADIRHALHSSPGSSDEAVSTLNAGYVWMALNCFCSAAFNLSMRKRIKLTNFKDFDSMLRVLAFSGTAFSTTKLTPRNSYILQQPTHYPGPSCMFPPS